MVTTQCRCCENKDLKSVINLGMSPLANNLVGSETEKADFYPLEVLFCQRCTYCQLSYTVEPEKLFDTYLYTSSTTKSFQNHFKLAAEKYINRFNLKETSLVVDIGCNDGIALIPFKDRGIRTFGIDPAANIVEITKSKGLDVLQGYFNLDTAEKVLKQTGHADIVTASNVFAHSANIEEIAKGAFKILKNDGTFIVEVQYLYDTLNDLTFDNIYHEHVSYWSVLSLCNFFEKLGLYVVDVEHIDTHGGSIRVYVQRDSSNVSKMVQDYKDKETKAGLQSYETYRQFGQKINNIKQNVLYNINQLKKQGCKIAGYGSPAKATTCLNYYGINKSHIDYVVEDNALKHGKYIPGTQIPILSKEHIKLDKPDILIVLAWNFFNDIQRNNPEFKTMNIKLTSIKQLGHSPEEFEIYLL
jgi:SAM-dependent methyltransferase